MIDIEKIKKEYNLTSNEIDEIIFLESLEDKTEYVCCKKCSKRIPKEYAEKYNSCCLPCFDFWYC